MPGIVINEDNSHYYFDRGPHGANEEKMREMARHYCQSQTAEVIYNLNSMRSNIDGLPFEPVWFEVEDRGSEGMFYRGKQLPDKTCNWIRGAKTAADAGLDPYRIWIDETRKLGRAAGISIRMNDIHCVDDENSFMHSEFWRKTPGFRREPGGLFHGWDSAALDFARQEVCDYAFSMVEAVLNRYDMDTLELDWMRFGHSVRPGFEDAGRIMLTEFQVRVREAARKREAELGRRITIAVRCPAMPQEAFDMGYDVIGWAQSGLIDRVVPCPFFSSTDFDIPIAFWRRILPAGFPLEAGLELRVWPGHSWSDFIVESPATLCAQAANYLAQGADRIYLFNHMDSDTTMPAGYNEIFDLVGSLETASAHERRHIITYHDRKAPGSTTSNLLPLTCRANGYSDYLRIELGPAPEPGRKCDLVIGTDAEADLVPVLNGVELTLAHTEVNRKVEAKGNALGGFASLQKIPMSSKMIYSFDASEAVKSGRNVFWFRSRSEKDVSVTWAEICIAGKQELLRTT